MNATLKEYFNAVHRSLLCKHCQERCEDPVQLRCGCIACSKCVAELTICCKKKVTAKDRENKHHLLTDVVLKLKNVDDLFHEASNQKKLFFSSPKATGVLGMNIERIKPNPKVEKDASLLQASAGSGILADKQKQQVIELTDTERTADLTGNLCPTLLRCSSSVTTIDGATCTHPSQNNKSISSPVESQQLHPLPSPFPEEDAKDNEDEDEKAGGKRNDVDADKDLLRVHLSPRQVPSETLLDTQKTSQGGFVWETQTQQSPDMERQGHEGVIYPSIIQDSYVEDISSTTLGHLSMQAPQGRVHAHDIRLLQRGGEDSLMLTASSATLSPTQIVEYIDHGNGNGDNFNFDTTPTDDAIKGRQIEELNVVPATLAVEEEVENDDEGCVEGTHAQPLHVPATLLSPVLSPVYDHVSNAKKEQLQQQPRRDVVRREVVSDTYDVLASSTNDNFINNNITSIETYSHKRQRFGSFHKQRPQLHQVVCDTYGADHDVGTSSVATSPDGSPPAGEDLFIPPDSEKTESSLYNVESFIEEYPIHGHIVSKSRQSSVPHPPEARSIPEVSISVPGSSRKGEGGIGVRVGKDAIFHTISHLESDWLDRNGTGGTNTSTGLRSTVDVDDVKKNDTVTDMDTADLDSLPPQSLTQGYDAGKACKEEEGEDRGVSPPLSPSVHPSIHLDLSLDIELYDSSQRNIKSVDRGSSRVTSSPSRMKQKPREEDDTSGSNRVPVPVALSSLSTTSGSAGMAGNTLSVPLLHQLSSSVGDRDENGDDDDDSALYEVVSDVSVSGSQGENECEMDGGIHYYTTGSKSVADGRSSLPKEVEEDVKEEEDKEGNEKGAATGGRVQHYEGEVWGAGGSITSNDTCTFDGGTDDSLPTMATWAHEDDKLLKDLFKRLPKATTTTTTTAPIASSRCRPVRSDAEISSEKQEEGWIETKNHRGAALKQLSQIELLKIPADDNHNNKNKARLALKESSFTCSAPCIPHFFIICSSALLGKTSLLEAKCESLGLFTCSRGVWSALEDNVPVLSESSSPLVPPPTHAASEGTAETTSRKTYHVVLVETEKCTQFSKMSTFLSSSNTSTNTNSGAMRSLYQCPRTMSFLKGMCMGYWLVDGPRWLQACLREGRAADLARFEVDMCQWTSPTAAPTRARSSLRLPADPSRSILFENCTFLVKGGVEGDTAPSSSTCAPTTGLTKKDILFMLYFCGGDVIPFPKGADKASLCPSCSAKANKSKSLQNDHARLHQSTPLRKKSVIVFNVAQPDMSQLVGKKRKNRVDFSFTGVQSTLLPTKCYLCHEKMSPVSASSSSLTLPVQSWLPPFPEVGVRWLVDSICTFEKKPLDTYLSSCT